MRAGADLKSVTHTFSYPRAGADLNRVTFSCPYRAGADFKSVTLSYHYTEQEQTKIGLLSATTIQSSSRLK